ncbi:hypothetical protein [Brevundimonas sp. TWP2-3-4b1]|uniref:hypothetical protein n=1 Tax=Brevundimonas sp. TWP2-3-4b1 TaxID=2804580 RepID=UPI003CE71011
MEERAGVEIARHIHDRRCQGVDGRSGIHGRLGAQGVERVQRCDHGGHGVVAMSFQPCGRLPLEVADLAAARILKLPRQRALDLERPGFAHSATFIGFINISIED